MVALTSYNWQSVSNFITPRPTQIAMMLSQNKKLNCIHSTAYATVNSKEMNQIPSLLDAQKGIYNNDGNTITVRNPYEDTMNYGNFN